MRPNILFVLSDQHNAKLLSHKGHPDVKTPNLDRLAGEGIRFDNAITQSPICTPSRVSFISGQYPHNHGYYGLCGPNPQGLTTILGHFRDSGYVTAAIGKIHCPEYWVEDDSDVFLETTNTSVGGMPEYESYLRERGVKEAYSQGHLRSADGRYQLLDGYASPEKFEDSPEGWIAQNANSFLSARADDAKPFLLHLSFNKPHQPYAPVREFWDMYPPGAISLPPNADYEMKHKAPNLLRTRREQEGGEWTAFEPTNYEAGRLRKQRGYLGNISQVDRALGLVLNRLEELGLDGNTIVVYSSDHGDYAGEHGIIEKAPGICSDAVTRIPMIWRVPNGPSNHRHDQIVEAVDLAPTLCSLAGVDALPTADGSDLSPLLLGESSAALSAVGSRIGVTETPFAKSIRKGRYRFVYYPKSRFPEDYPDGFGELYDLEADPWEMNNLYFQESYREVIDEIRQDFVDWLVTSTRVKTAQPPRSEPGAGQVRRHLRWVDADGKIGPADLARRSIGRGRDNYL
jgi:choline-sulfatase/uncharacterized sulfatase